MFKVEDILAELEGGRSIEDIAKEVTVKLNEAQTSYKKAQEQKRLEEERAKKAALQKRAEKEKRAGSLIDGLFDYLTDFHPAFFSPDEVANFKRHFDAAAMVDAIDETIKQIEAIPAVAEEMRKKGSGSITVQLSEKDAKQASELIDKFLRENDLF